MHPRGTLHRVSRLAEVWDDPGACLRRDANGRWRKFMPAQVDVDGYERRVSALGAADFV